MLVAEVAMNWILSRNFLSSHTFFEFWTKTKCLFSDCSSAENSSENEIEPEQITIFCGDYLAGRANRLDLFC